MTTDAIAVQNLIFLYAERIDAGDFAAVGDMFAQSVITVEHDPGVEMRGAAAAKASYDTFTRRFDDNGTPHTKHVTTNLILDVDEDAGTASCRSYFTVFQCTDLLPLQAILNGRYHDRFERTDNDWHFTHRHIIMDYAGDLSQHMLQDPMGGASSDTSE